MIRFPNAKINLGLHVTSKREDGYHNLESVFYPVNCRDALEIIKSNDASISFSSSGNNIEGEPSENLCMKAAKMLQKDFPGIHSLIIHLLKQIPSGAGLGGGSSDAVACLQMLNEIFNLKLSNEALKNYALQLGSDCPFFIENKPAYITGRGENIETIEFSLKAFDILIVHPGLHISTRQAFDGLDPARTSTSRENIKDIISLHPSQWKGKLVNDFEKSVFMTYPQLADLKEKLYNNGAIYASMTGSGSSVYGIFEKNQRPLLDLPDHYYSSWN